MQIVPLKKKKETTKTQFFVSINTIINIIRSFMRLFAHLVNSVLINASQTIVKSIHFADDYQLDNTRYVNQQTKNELNSH